MPTLDVIDLEGKTVDTMEVSDDVLAAEVKEHLLWEVVRAQRAAAHARRQLAEEESWPRAETLKARSIQHRVPQTDSPGGWVGVCVGGWCGVCVVCGVCVWCVWWWWW